MQQRRATLQAVFADRTARRVLHELLAIVAKRNRRLGLEFVGGLGRHIVDRTAERIATVECRLRAFDDLDALEIELVEVDALTTGNVDAIKENCGVEFAKDINGRHAANHGCGQEVTDHVGKRQARREGCHIVQVADAARLNGLGGECRDRQWHVDELFALLARRDHYFLESGTVIRLCPGRRRGASCDDQRNGRRCGNPTAGMNAH